MNANLTWDMQSIFAGGSKSVALANFLTTLEDDLTRAGKAAPLPFLTEKTQSLWLKTIEHYYDLSARFEQAYSFTDCLTAQDTADETAMILSTRLGNQFALLENLWTQLGALSALQVDEAWNALLALPALNGLTFDLNEQRALARRKMLPEVEALISELSADGYHGWGQLYKLVSGAKAVEIEIDGALQTKSLGQLQFLFEDDADRNLRRRAFSLYQSAWAELAPVCAQALNFQAGFRLTTYRRRGWDSVLQEPLFLNRLTAQTLETMWAVVADKSARLLDYFSAKAALLNIDRLHWYDLNAPVGQVSGGMTFSQAATFLMDHIGSLNPDIADFCRMAIDQRWVEAEDRPGKAAGAFCNGFPLTRQSRIFMTFGNTYGAMSTLAHELGHGYHNWVMKDLPYGAKKYTMGVAETASTFNELAVTDAYLKTLTNPTERLGLLARKLDDAVAFLMNIRARFDFERAFFAERAKGALSVEQISALMVQAQQTAYCHGLDSEGYHPLFWASKGHFYMTYMPFYNFPYTFGYLFSNGVYTMALDDPHTFNRRYTALLRDTGSMDTESLARLHLGVDLSAPAFWETTIDRILADVDEFGQLVRQLTNAL